jgi:acetyl esterase/lipase
VVATSVWPPLDDIQAWRDVIAAREREQRRGLFEAAEPGDAVPTHTPPTADVQDRRIDGVPVYVVRPEDSPLGDRRIYLELHGGGFIHYGGELCRAMAIHTAGRVGAPVWSVDYRLAPDHPFPAALDDAVTVYRALLRERRPQEIIIGGPSAGGNLTAALILRARDEGLPLPAAAVMESPGLDLTESGDSWLTNLGLDNVLTQSYMPVFRIYAGGRDLTDPYVSPLFGDFTKGFPPSLLTSGTRDMLLSDTVRMHRALLAAGVDAELHVWEAAAHAKFLGAAPEDADHARQIRSFVEKHWPCPAA